jgi:hypothetical protein
LYIFLNNGTNLYKFFLISKRMKGKSGANASKSAQVDYTKITRKDLAKTYQRFHDDMVA